MRKEVTHRDGYIIIRRGESRIETIPLSCPLCECVTIDEIDTIAIMRTGCCFDCENEVADPNRAKWISGWRPNNEEIETIKSKRLASYHSRTHN